MKLVLLLVLFSCSKQATSSTPKSNDDFREFLALWEKGQNQFINGDATLWNERVVQSPEVTIFGAFGGFEKGWAEVGPRFDWAASQHANTGATKRLEYLNVIVGADIAVTVAIERDRVRVGDQPEPVERGLRATQVFRRENGEWKLIHRQADPLLEKKTPGAKP